jgi:hypothetical protein
MARLHEGKEYIVKAKKKIIYVRESLEKSDEGFLVLLFCAIEHVLSLPVDYRCTCVDLSAHRSHSNLSSGSFYSELIMWVPDTCNACISVT